MTAGLMLKLAAVVALFSALSYVGISQVVEEADPWLDPVVTEGELEATRWIRGNTEEDARFVAGIFGGELIMGMTTRIPLVGGDWANAPDPVEKMLAVHRIYRTDSAAEAYELAVEHGADYVYVPLKRSVHSGLGWIYPQVEKFDDSQYFVLVYENPEVRIYRVRPVAP